MLNKYLQAILLTAYLSNAYAQEFLITLNADASNDAVGLEINSKDNLANSPLVVHLDKGNLSPEILEKLSSVPNIVFADLPELPQFVNLKEYISQDDNGLQELLKGIVPQSNNVDWNNVQNNRKYQELENVFNEFLKDTVDSKKMRWRKKKDDDKEKHKDDNGYDNDDNGYDNGDNDYHNGNNGYHDDDKHKSSSAYHKPTKSHHRPSHSISDDHHYSTSDDHKHTKSKSKSKTKDHSTTHSEHKTTTYSSEKPTVTQVTKSSSCPKTTDTVTHEKPTTERHTTTHTTEVPVTHTTEKETTITKVKTESGTTKHETITTKVPHTKPAKSKVTTTETIHGTVTKSTKVCSDKTCPTDKSETMTKIKTRTKSPTSTPSLIVYPQINGGNMTNITGGGEFNNSNSYFNVSITFLLASVIVSAFFGLP